MKSSVEDAMRIPLSRLLKKLKEIFLLVNVAYYYFLHFHVFLLREGSNSAI